MTRRGCPPDCPDRSAEPNCHTNCERYAEYTAEYAKRRKPASEIAADGYTIYMLRKIRRSKGKRRNKK